RQAGRGRADPAEARRGARAHRLLGSPGRRGGHMLNCFVADSGAGTRPVHVVAASQYRDWLSRQPAHVRAWLEGSAFEAKAGRSALRPGADGGPAAALLVQSEPAEPWDFAALRDRLPAGDWCLQAAGGELDPGTAALGWALASYRFERYRKNNSKS